MDAPSRHALWNHFQSQLFPDGSLRDLYVLETDLRDWERLLAHLRQRYPLSWEAEEPLPESAAEAFEGAKITSTVLGCRVGRLLIYCHFFDVNEIELDLNPREIQGEEDFETLLQLMRSLGEALGRDVLLTLENCPKAVIIQYIVAKSGFPAGSWWGESLAARIGDV